MRFRTSLSMAAVIAITPLPALAGDLDAEITNAAMHAGLAAQAGDIAGVHTHLHHVVNCLVGPGGTGFDAKELNPCANSGGGAIPDATKAATKQRLETALAKANSGLASDDLATAQQDASAIATMLKGVK
jgi:hypothetical protein